MTVQVYILFRRQESYCTFDVVVYIWVDISLVYFTWRGHYKTIMRGFCRFLITSMSRRNGVKLLKEKRNGVVYTPFTVTTSYQRNKTNSLATSYPLSLSNSRRLFVILFNIEYLDGLVFHLL